MANHPGVDKSARDLLVVAVDSARNGDTEKALELFARILEYDAHFAEAYNQLAILLLGTGRLLAAIAVVRRATLAEPNSAKYWSNLGIMLVRACEFEEGLAALRHAATLDPHQPETFHNLGTLYHQIGDYPAAIASYDRSLTLRPDNVDVLFDRSVSLLASGDLATGFAAYETRLLRKNVGLDFVKSIPIPIWEGEDLRGKTIIVYGEQGFGDTIQFARLLPAMADRGARVIFYCRSELVRVLSSLGTTIEVRPFLTGYTPMPPAHFHSPLLSLATRLGVTLATIPNATPYLSLSRAIDRPRLVRGQDTVLSVGLVWAGAQSNTNDANRSIALEHFFPLTGIAGVECFSLQIGPRAADLATSGATSLIHDLSPSITDFADTAALIEQLDLVITVDTAVAHLAGALGRPAFVLLPYTPDWRWLGHRKDSPWYPSLRLFRQKTPLDWKEVLCDVRTAVTELALRQR